MIGLQIIDRLETIHELNFLHLDLKLENLMVGIDFEDERVQEQDIVYMVDFGIS